MLNTSRLLKVSAAWVSIIYTICFVVVASAPMSRNWFMMYGMHTSFNLGPSVTTVSTFIAGLIFWNILILLGVWLFASLYNSIKK